MSRLCRLQVIKWERDTLDASFLSKWFIEFYKGEPWNEYLICPQCKAPDDFGPSNTYGFDEARSLNCLVCGEILDFFWGPERVMRYLFRHPGGDGEVAFYDGEVAAWWRGYPLSSQSFYVDVVALIPNFRKRPGYRIFLEKFKKFLDKKRKEGFKKFITRTHRKAKNVRFLLRTLGFRENGPSEDPDRTYWSLYL